MKSRWLKWLLLSILAVLAVSLATQALAAAGDTTRISVASDGTQGNQNSLTTMWEGFGHLLSADGRYVVYSSDASNLVSGDTNGTRDVFIHDRQTHVTTRVSIASDGAQSNGHSEQAAITADGRYVVYISGANNLVTNDTNGTSDVFVHDMQAGTTTRASIASDGIQGNKRSWFPTISGDGRYVVFDSSSTNLVGGDTNEKADIFIHDMQTGSTSRVSLASDGTQGNDVSFHPFISENGRYVAFGSYANNLVGGDTNGGIDIFMHDMQTGTTTRVSISSDGTQANGTSLSPSLSADGRFVAFESKASNLVSDDTNGAYDIFIHDMQTGTTTRASIASDGSQFGDSYSASLSSDGRYIAFQSYAIFIHDTQTGMNSLVSVASDGTNANNASMFPSISGNGRYVVFSSSATNLVSGDTNGRYDVFVHETDVIVPIPTPTPTPAILPDTGFTPQQLTIFSPQPVEKVYSDLGDLWLEIPRLGVQMPIIGVPQTDGEWDVSWLGNQAGWLNGTAFPTWAGNSVLTGHVYDAYGRPGPFVHLNGLWWGDKVIVHAWGVQYIYEVRKVTQVEPGAISSVIQHEELAWVTLITCRGYDEASNSYKYRVVVRAVLVEIK